MKPPPTKDIIRKRIIKGRKPGILLLAGGAALFSGLGAGQGPLQADSWNVSVLRGQGRYSGSLEHSMQYGEKLHPDQRGSVENRWKDDYGPRGMRMEYMLEGPGSHRLRFYANMFRRPAKGDVKDTEHLHGSIPTVSDPLLGQFANGLKNGPNYERNEGIAEYLFQSSSGDIRLGIGIGFASFTRKTRYSLLWGNASVGETYFQTSLNKTRVSGGMLSASFEFFPFRKFGISLRYNVSLNQKARLALDMFEMGIAPTGGFPTYQYGNLQTLRTAGQANFESAEIAFHYEINDSYRLIFGARRTDQSEKYEGVEFYNALFQSLANGGTPSSPASNQVEFSGNFNILHPRSKRELKSRDVYVYVGIEFRMTGEPRVDLDGYSRVRYTNGARYNGRFQDGEKHGRGRLRYNDASHYEGEWKRGRKSGEGFQKGLGWRYRGEWKHNEPHGKGVMKWEDGSEYSGEFRRGRPHGQGRLKRPNGSVERGVWKNGRKAD